MGAPVTQFASFNEILAQLHRQVRMGNFVDSKALAEECWRNRALADSEHLRLRAHTLCWDVADALGESARAFTYLRADGTDQNCLQLIESANKDPGPFRDTQFPSERTPADKRPAYKLWRQ